MPPSSGAFGSMDALISDVAVIGAGLGGCAVAIALAKQGAKVTVYESRSELAEGVHSGVVLSPNGLRVLAHLGLYDRIKDSCYTSSRRTFKNDKDETVKKVVSANEELHGYSNHRLWRSILLSAMRTCLVELEVPVMYDSRLENIVEDRHDGVSFTINGQEKQASLLIASDGIHSTARKYIAPEIRPYYTGTTGVLAHIPRSSVAWPYEDYERNATIQGKPGAIFFIPEDPKAETIMTGIQIAYPEQDRDDLARLQNDKDKLVGFYQNRYEQYGETARSIIDSVVANKQSCYIWPFEKMPKLEKWYSETGKIVIIGDGAHALPPSSAQGVNQALEDAYTLTKTLRSSTESTSLTHLLAKWQSARQKRIDAVFDWATNVTNVSRLPEEERAKLKVDEKQQNGSTDDMSWLYGYDVAVDFHL